MLPNLFVMKASNTVSAYTLEHEAYGASRDTLFLWIQLYQEKKIDDCSSRSQIKSDRQKPTSILCFG